MDCQKGAREERWGINKRRPLLKRLTRQATTTTNPGIQLGRGQTIHLLWSINLRKRLLHTTFLSIVYYLFYIHLSNYYHLFLVLLCKNSFVMIQTACAKRWGRRHELLSPVFSKPCPAVVPSLDYLLIPPDIIHTPLNCLAHSWCCVLVVILLIATLIYKLCDLIILCKIMCPSGRVRDFWFEPCFVDRWQWALFCFGSVLVDDPFHTHILWDDPYGRCDLVEQRSTGNRLLKCPLCLTFRNEPITRYFTALFVLSFLNSSHVLFPQLFYFYT